MTNKNELKPCPFCGGEAKILKINIEDSSIVCRECPAQMAYHGTFHSEEWNTRTETLSSREDIDKALDDLKDLFDMAIDFGDQVGGNEARTSMLFESVEKTLTAMKGGK